MKTQSSEVVTTSSFAWNTIGSIIAALSSFILLSCVTHAVGAKDGGIFAFAFSSAQLLLTVGKYGVRAYQATDVTRVISIGTYFITRILSCSSMLLLSLGVILMFGYREENASVILAVCFLKMIDAIEDVYHGQLQLNNRLDEAGKLLAARNLLTIILFGVLIFSTEKIDITCWLTAAISTIACFWMNHQALKKYESIDMKLQWGELKIVLMACLPLFLGHFLSLYIYNAPKYAIEMFCSSDIQTYYNVIFMPAFVINLLSEFLFKPLLTSMAVWWEENNIDKFVSFVIKMIGYIVIVTIVALIGTYLVGAEILSIVFGIDILPYKTELLILMSGGGFGAVVYFFYNILTSMRQQKSVLRNYFLAAVMISLVAFNIVNQFGITAAALSYCSTEIILCGLMLCSVVKAVKIKKKGE